MGIRTGIRSCRRLLNLLSVALSDYFSELCPQLANVPSKHFLKKDVVNRLGGKEADRSPVVLNNLA
jgi:hypothetical protein